jgi:hypothetical protein
MRAALLALCALTTAQPQVGIFKSTWAASQPRVGISKSTWAASRPLVKTLPWLLEYLPVASSENSCYEFCE